MKIARIAHTGGPIWALVDPDRGRAVRIPGPIAEWGPILVEQGAGAIPLAEEREFDLAALLAPVEAASKVVCLGATYATHVARLGHQMPQRPAGFWKPVSALLEEGADIEYPAITNALDYEAELVAVVGGSNFDRSRPMHNILGYTIGNEVTARDLQFDDSFTGMDVFSAKSFDRTSGIGPWIITRDEFGDQHPDLELRLDVDEEVRQRDRTSNMVWPVDQLADFVDQRTRLRTGDILFTGTTHGIGHEDGRYLQPGQQVNVAIEGIGTLHNRVGSKPTDTTR